MILTTHALTGAVIGKNVDNVWLIILSAILFHFIFDSLPHGEYIETINKKSNIKNTWWKVGLDLSLGLSIIFAFIFWSNFDSIKIRNILIGSFFSMFPDFLTFLYWKFNFKFLEKIYEFNLWIHHIFFRSQDRKWNFRNAINDILVCFISILLLVFLS